MLSLFSKFSRTAKRRKSLQGCGSIELLENKVLLSAVTTTGGTGETELGVGGFNESTGRWYYGYYEDGQGLIQLAGPQWSTTAGWDIHGGDFNGDGFTDGAGRTEDGAWYVVDGVTGETTYWGKWGSNAAHQWNDPNVQGEVFVADFNNDGMDDVAGKNWRGEFYVGLSNGSGFDTTYWGRVAQTGWVAHRAGDFNGDGNTDIVSFHENGARWVSESDGTSFTLDYYGRVSSQAAAGWQNFQVGDFNDDGNDDILQQAGSANGQWWMGTSNGLTNGVFTTSYAGRWDPTAFEDFLVADFNGDGRDDLAGRTNANEWYVNVSQVAGGMVTSYWGRWGSAYDFNSVALDFDCDGDADIVGTIYATGHWFTQLSDGSSSFSNVYLGQLGNFTGDNRFSPAILDV